MFHGFPPFMHAGGGRMPAPPPAVPGTQHYVTLGVERTASSADIKRAYMKKARETHPDSASKSSDADEESFKALTAAYQVLSDSEKRAAYDRAGDEGVKELEAMGGGRRQAMVPPVHARTTATFADIMHGSEKSVTYQRQMHGAAEVRTIQVYVPKGHVSDVPVVVTGEGHDGVGDVLVTVDTPQSDGVFTRNGGCDLAYKATIPLWRALIGGTIEVPPLPGSTSPLHVQLPREKIIKTGDELELPHHGLPVFGMPDTRGSLLVVIEVNMELPSHVSREQMLMAASHLGAPPYLLLPGQLHTDPEDHKPLTPIDRENLQQRRQLVQNAVREKMEEQSHGGMMMMPGGGHVQQVQCAQQ